MERVINFDMLKTNSYELDHNYEEVIVAVINNLDGLKDSNDNLIGEVETIIAEPDDNYILIKACLHDASLNSNTLGVLYASSILGAEIRIYYENEMEYGLEIKYKNCFTKEGNE